MTAFLLGATAMIFFMFAMLSRPTRAENFFLELTCSIGGLGDQDCEAPVAPTLTGPDDYVKDNEFLFSWNAVNDESNPITYKVCVSGASSFCKDTIETSLPASELIENTAGTWQWRVIAKDGVGNSENWSESRTVTIDPTDPTAAVTVSAELIGGNVPAVTISGTVDDEHLRSYTLSILDESNTVIESSTVATEGQHADVNSLWNAVDPKQLSGNYWVSLVARDAADRTFESKARVVVDNDGPLTKVTGGDTIIRGGSISPIVSAEDPHGDITYAWVASTANPAILTYVSTDKQPVFTPTVEGSYRYTLTTTDRLGNTSTSVFRFDYVAELPLLPPLVEVTGGPSALEVAATALPSAVSPTSTPTRDARSETSEDTKTTNQVLGSTISNTNEPVATTRVAALTPTNSGWSILGILWYWWLLVIAAVIAASMLARRYGSPRVNQDS